MTKHLVILISLLSPALAGAQPSLSAASEPAPRSQSYVAFGAMAGADVGLDLALTGEVGYRLHGGPLWLHAQVTDALWNGDDQGSGVLRNVRGGIEARKCTDDGVACLVGGIDIGLQHATWVDREDSMQTETHDDVIAVPRVGLDFGGEHLRFRPAIESYHALAGDDVFKNPYDLVGTNLTFAVAYQW